MKKTFLFTLLLAVVFGFTTANAQQQPWECPDLGPNYGPSFSGNVADPDNPYQYVAIWEGVTIGCVPCPTDLVFDEAQNLCVYNALFGIPRTEICPSQYDIIEETVFHAYGKSTPSLLTWVSADGLTEWLIDLGVEYTLAGEVVVDYTKTTKRRIQTEETFCDFGLGLCSRVMCGEG